LSKLKKKQLLLVLLLVLLNQLLSKTNQSHDLLLAYGVPPAIWASSALWASSPTTSGALQQSYANMLVGLGGEAYDDFAWG
jgi:hypothetical protein